MVQELKAAFAPFGYLLTSAVSPGQINIDIAYDIPRLSAALDFINVNLYNESKVLIIVEHKQKILNCYS